MPSENPFKVKLVEAGYRNNPHATGQRRVTFNASPSVSENRNVNYHSLEPLHAPGQIQVYKNTASRNFQIADVRIISRTIEEADANLRKLWTLRGWCMPRFGKNSSTLNDTQREYRGIHTDEEKRLDREELGAVAFSKNAGTELLGAPPPILYLSAYSQDIGDSTNTQSGDNSPVWKIAQHINRIPVVINQLTIPYPNDIDYITTSTGVPMPIIMNLDLALLETHSPDSYESFSLNAFKEDRLAGF